jgi:hypothetical protein
MAWLSCFTFINTKAQFQSRFKLINSRPLASRDIAAVQNSRDIWELVPKYHVEFEIFNVFRNDRND